MMLVCDDGPEIYRVTPDAEAKPLTKNRLASDAEVTESV